MAPLSDPERRTVAVDVSEVSKLEVEPGELPKSMAAWVIRPEREGEPRDAVPLETTWGSFAQFTKVQAQQLLPKPWNLSWVESSAYGLTYFTAYRMLIDRCNVQAGHNVLIWGAAGGLGVFATQICKTAGANAVGVVSSAEKGELVKQLGAVDYI